MSNIFDAKKTESTLVYDKSISKLTDKPNRTADFGGDGMTSTQLKAQFDASPQYIASLHNGLIDLIKGSTAAANIGAVKNSVATTIQVYLDYCKQEIDRIKTSVGYDEDTHLSASIAELNDAMSDINGFIGTLASLTTTEKESLVAAINEVNSKTLFIRYSSGSDVTTSVTSTTIKIGFRIAVAASTSYADYTWTRYIPKEIASVSISGLTLTVTYTDGTTDTVDIDTADCVPATPMTNFVVSVNGKTATDGIITLTAADIGAATPDDVALKANDSDVVKKSGEQTVAGVKTFSSSPVVPSAAANNEAVNLGQLNTAISALTGVYDKVISTQAQFDALVASPTWQDAVSVAFKGQFTLSIDSAGSTLARIPSNVKQIQGFNNAKITISTSVYINGFYYTTKPSGGDCSIINLELYVPRGYGFANCVNIFGCKVTAINPVTTGGASQAFYNCDNIVNSIGIAEATGNGSAYGFYNCTGIVNCSGRGMGGGSNSGYSFYNCSRASSCIYGGSSGNENGMWGGTNTGIDPSAYKTPASVVNTTLNA